MKTATKERLIDKLRDELYKKHNWTGEKAVNFMVPIILAIRHKDAQALAANSPENESIVWALNDLRQGGKGELDTTLNQVSSEYSSYAVSPLLRDTLGDMIRFVTRQPDGIIYDILDYLHRNKPLLQALRDEDFIGTLFERSVSEAFRGDDGRFYTPRNIILLVREMMHLLLKKEDPSRPVSTYTICDPCSGSARFLIYWSELIIDEIKRSAPFIKPLEQLKRLKEMAESSLFGADVHEETAAYGCLNMLLHGDGATNIVNQDSLDHFGFFADMPLLREFAQEFEAKWEVYSAGPARQRADVANLLDAIETKRAVISDLLTATEIDFSDAKWLGVNEVIRALLEVDRKYSTNWDTVHNLQRRFKRPAVFETMLDEWANRNPSIANGFDIIITNPPFGRQSELMLSDPYLLCQYRLATELWIQDMNKGMVEGILSRTLAEGEPLHIYYRKLVEQQFGKIYVDEEDEVFIERLPVAVLRRLAQTRDFKTAGLNKGDLSKLLVTESGRSILILEDGVCLNELSTNEVKRVCSKYLYTGNNPGEKLAQLITSYFGKEWLNVEDIEGPDSYASKITLVFGEKPHTIYYDSKGMPIIYKNTLPKQVLFIEQFLRMVKQGGKVFTVLDVGALNNVGDEYVRRFLYENAKVHAVVEMVHGAFRAANANVRTAVLMYEKKRNLGKGYKVFLSVPQYLGYRLNDQNVPHIRENDLGKVLCDYSVSLGLGELYSGCGNCVDVSVAVGNEVCCWARDRVCRYWLEQIDPASVDYPSAREAAEYDLLSILTEHERTCDERRLDPKFFVYEQRFNKLAMQLEQEGLDVKLIAEIAKEPIHRGVQPEYDDLEGIIPVLKTVDVQNRKIDWSECRRATSEFYRDNSRARLEKNDIVLTSTGEGSWGRAAIVDIDKALADGHLTILRVKEGVIDAYAVLAFLWSEYGRMQFEQRVRGSTGQTEIYPQDIEKIKVLIPSDKEQFNIARKIKKQFALLEQAEKLRMEAVQEIENLLGKGE